jgi:hypothetical protein
MSRATDEFDDFDDDIHATVQPHRGVMILVFGILGVLSISCVLLGFLGIFAWVMGKRDLELMRRGQMDKEGRSLTHAGYILGIVGTILFMLQSLFWVAYIAFIAYIFATR